MSAVTKPLIHTTAATVNPSPFVNVEQVAGIEKFDVNPGRPGGTVNQWGIRFLMKNASDTPRSIEWIFDVEATRNTKFGTAFAAISTAV